MNQNTSLYSIERTNFKKLAHHPGEPVPGSLSIEHVTFHQTHEGLKFILSKGQIEEMLDLVAEIFYPVGSFGQVIELETIDTVIVGKDYIHVDNPVFYHAPAKVLQIHELLKSVDEETFLVNFDADELNSEDIYPGTWNSQINGRSAFNQVHLLEDFKKLRLFFAKAANECSYVLVFVTN